MDQVVSVRPQFPRNTIQIICIGIVALLTSSATFASPPGNIVFLGKTSDNSRSVWLSTTLSGSFEVQANNTAVDDWMQPQAGLHVTFSPSVSNGSGNPHSLYQVINGNLVFIAKDNQQGGITFPPFPGGNPPGEVTPPIFLPPPEPTHPIALPPDGSSNAPNPNAKKSAFTNKVPITRGREFARQPRFNIWTDFRYFGITDNRFGLDRNGDATNVTIGADRRINNKLVIGGMLNYNTAESSSFDDSWKTNSQGFSVGPYFGYIFLPNWALDGTVGFGQFENKNNISILNSKYTTNIYAASFMATGVYELNKSQIRLKPAIYYNYFQNSAYDLNAVIGGVAYSVPIDSYNFSLGLAQFAIQLARTFMRANNAGATVPYIELGVNYLFVQPNGGQILTGDLTMQSTSALSGLARLGVRTSVTRSFFIDATASYLSIGQSNLYVWEARLFLSWAIY